MAGQNLEDLAQLKGVDASELEPQLKKMCRQGLMYEIKRESSVRYRLNDSYFVFFRSTFWPGTDDQTSKYTAPLANKYFHDGFYEQYAPIHAKGLRALPIDDTRKILPYEDVAEGKGFRSTRDCARLQPKVYGRPQEGGAAAEDIRYWIA